MEEPLSEEEIDGRVIAQIDDPSAWEEPIEVQVHRDVPAKRNAWIALCVLVNLVVLLAVLFVEGGKPFPDFGLFLGGPLAAASAIWSRRQPSGRAASWLLWLITLFYVFFWCIVIFDGRHDQPPTSTTVW